MVILAYNHLNLSFVFKWGILIGFLPNQFIESNSTPGHTQLWLANEKTGIQVQQVQREIKEWSD